MRNTDTIENDIQTLIYDRLTDKQRARFAGMTGCYADRLRRITKAAWVSEAIADVERRQTERTEREWQREETFAALVKDRTFAAEVRWFDRSSGVGVVHIPELGSSWTLYACNIAGARTYYPETASVYYDKGQQIDVKIDYYVDESLVCGTTPGTLDTTKWDAIEHNIEIGRRA
jgi:hypothetical protein